MSAVDLNDQNISELSYQLEVEVVLDLEDRIPRGCWKPGCRSPAGLFRGVSEEDWPLSVSGPRSQRRSGVWLLLVVLSRTTSRVSMVDGSLGDW